MKINTIIGYITSIVYAMLGFTIAAGSLNDTKSMAINIIIATFILIIAVVFYYRTRALNTILQKNKIENKSLKQFYLSNVSLQVIELFFGLTLLLLAMYRSINEGFAVFD